MRPTPITAVPNGVTMLILLTMQKWRRERFGKRLCALLPILMAVCGGVSSAQETKKPAPEPDAFDYVLGTQTIAPAYHFTQDTSLVETAKAIQAMGSNILKISLSPDYAQKYP